MACLPPFLSFLPSFVAFCSCFYLVSSFLYLSSCPPLVLSLCGLFWALFLFPFPFRYIRKKKGRKVFSLRPLLSCCVVVYKSSNITVIFCGSSFPYLAPLQVMPATLSGSFVGSFTICPFSSMVEYLQLFRQSEG